jgi:hypothetical protein
MVPIRVTLYGTVLDDMMTGAPVADSDDGDDCLRLYELTA